MYIINIRLLSKFEVAVVNDVEGVGAKFRTEEVGLSALID